MLVRTGTTQDGNRYRVISRTPARTFNDEFIIRIQFVLTGHEQIITLAQFESGNFTDESRVAPTTLEPAVEPEAVSIETKDTKVEVTKEAIVAEAEEVKVEKTTKKTTTKSKAK